MIALYPIKPAYTDRILSGEKKYELRKRLPNSETKYILIYATTPVAKVVGYGEVKGFHRTTVENLWKLVSPKAGIDEASYQNYFGEAEKACAIEFSRVYKFVRPFSVDDIRPSFTVPQSFCYIEQSIFRRLKRRKVLPV